MIQNKRNSYAKQNVRLMDLKTFLYLICILLKLLLFQYFLQNCIFGFHIIKDLLKHHHSELKCHLSPYQNSGTQDPKVFFSIRITYLIKQNHS